MCRRALTRTALRAVGSLLLSAMAASPAPGQATAGKIQGRVLATTGVPIAAAQVSVDGTNLGNITDEAGFYFINQVPPGLHSVRAQVIGYRTVVAEQQRVLAGHTATLNFSLEPAVIPLQELVVTGERSALAPRDQLSSRAITTGETIAELPLDRAGSIILLSPGVIETNSGLSIRGAREDEHAVYVDGVPVRNLVSGATAFLELGTNTLAQVDVTTGGVAARYGNAQSGLVNFVTRSGSADFGGAVSFYTDDFAPKHWRTGSSRLQLSAGGPLAGALRFFVGGTAEGNRYRAMPQGFNRLTRYVPSGVDTVIRLPSTSPTATATDSVEVVIPNFVEWEEGATSPSRVADNYNLTAKLSYGLGAGSRAELTYYRNRRQGLNRGYMNGTFNPEGWTGALETQNTLTLAGYFLLQHSAERALALDVKASYQRDWSQSGLVRPEYLADHLSPPFGFNVDALDFVLNAAEWPVTQKIINASRANLLPPSQNMLLPGRADLALRQGVAGVADNLRLNPYALRSDFPISGHGNVAQSWAREDRWYGQASLDWQTNRFNRLWLGGELTRSLSAARTVMLYQGLATPRRNDPVIAGAFLQDRVDLGDLVLEGGLRLDYFDPGGDFPLIPGFVFNVPDSLSRDQWELVEGDAPALDRLVLRGDCGGEKTAAQRTNAAGEVVCKNNFVRASTHTALSPKLAVSFPATPTSTFRLSYGRNTQPPTLGQVFSSSDWDFGGGAYTTSFGFGRDVEIPVTVAFEAGYRQLFGGRTVLDVSVYSRTSRNSLSYRYRPYADPNTGQVINVVVLQNADASLARGVDAVLDQRIGNALDLGLSYTYLSAQGSGWEPWSFWRVMLRRQSNISALTGEPVYPPDVMFPLVQSRTHTLRGKLELQLDHDALGEHRLLNLVFRDVMAFATLRVSSGLPFTRYQNDATGSRGPPADDDGIAAEAVNASRTPLEKRFDLRLVKAFPLLGRSARLFADFRNPLGLTNQDVVWLETGSDRNALHRDSFINSYLAVSSWDGDAVIDDFVIPRDSEKNNPVNQYMLLEAERRFGDGDGTFTVAEQRRMMGDYYNLLYGTQHFRDTNRYLRLGFEVVF